MDLSKSWKFENSTTWNLNCLTMMDTKMISASELALYLLLTSLIHAPIEEQVKPIIPNSRKIKTSPCPHSYKSICDICDKSEDISISRPMKRTFADLESTIEDCDNNIIERTWGADGMPHIIDHQAKKHNFKDKSKEKTQPQVKQGSRAKPETGESSKSNSKADGYDDEDNDPNKRRRGQSKGGESRERMSWTCCQCGFLNNGREICIGNSRKCHHPMCSNCERKFWSKKEGMGKDLFDHLEGGSGSDLSDHC